jgi:Fe2+ or Zn2+ uptake regulation protein
MSNIHRYKTEIIALTQTGHRTAEEIYKKIKKYNVFLGIGTIYRNLTELVNEWVLMKHHGLGDKILYEKNKPPHWHLFCQYTGMIEDVDISMVDFTGLQIPDNFCMEEIQLTIAGHFKGEESAYCKINGKLLR